ncbi:MAG: hypothetical protein QW356_04690 [Candidatus Hadarchaeales archaeon]
MGVLKERPLLGRLLGQEVKEELPEELVKVLKSIVETCDMILEDSEEYEEAIDLDILIHESLCDVADDIEKAAELIRHQLPQVPPQTFVTADDLEDAPIVLSNVQTIKSLIKRAMKLKDRKEIGEQLDASYTQLYDCWGVKLKSE